MLQSSQLIGYTILANILQNKGFPDGSALTALTTNLKYQQTSCFARLPCL